MSIAKVGIIANIAKDKAPEYTSHLRKWLLSKGVDVYVEESIAGKIGDGRGVERKKLAGLIDLLVVFGGDGTILRAARTFREVDIPIVGINMGGFGYLTEVNLNEMYSALELILKGEFRTEDRMMLDVMISRDKEPAVERTVLNDVVINRGNLSRIVEMETAVNDQYLTTFKADGLIISTPTGSTAYSLSAGGPIVFPEQSLLIINPICPHTLTNRPIILPEGAELKIILWTKEQGATVTFDGQVSYTLKSGDTMAVRKSQFSTKLVCSPHRDYLEILRTKLGWGRSPTAVSKTLL